jgi:hypothetical protein
MEPTPQEHLKNYVSERLAALVPAVFEDGPDLPSFTTDQRSKPLERPPYSN